MFFLFFFLLIRTELVQTVYKDISVLKTKTEIVFITKTKNRDFYIPGNKTFYKTKTRTEIISAFFEDTGTISETITKTIRREVDHLVVREI